MRACNVIKRKGYYYDEERGWITDGCVLFLEGRELLKKREGLKFIGPLSPSHLARIEEGLEELKKAKFYSAVILFYAYYNSETEEYGYCRTKPLAFLEGQGERANWNFVVFKADSGGKFVYNQRYINMFHRFFKDVQWAVGSDGVLLAENLSGGRVGCVAPLRPTDSFTKEILAIPGKFRERGGES